MGPKYKLSDSESESEPDVSTVPFDKSLEKGLRDEIARIFKSGNMEDLTVKRVRLAAEKKLGLAEGYFKTTGDWKARSEQIIKAEVVRDLLFNWHAQKLFWPALTCNLYDIGRAGKCAKRRS